MSTVQTWQTASTNLDGTLEIAMKIGRKLQGGEVVELIGDLGTGKTAFVKGLAQGLGISDTVHSPSFTISNQYKGKRLSLYHFDFYRLKEPGIMHDELAEVLTDLKAVTAIEWSQIVEDILPAKRLTINIKATGEDSREFTMSHPDSLKRLLPRNT